MKEKKKLVVFVITSCAQSDGPISPAVLLPPDGPTHSGDGHLLAYDALPDALLDGELPPLLLVPDRQFFFK